MLQPTSKFLCLSKVRISTQGFGMAQRSIPCAMVRAQQDAAFATPYSDIHGEERP
jgi:hypothetical protein